ncbi:MAG: hypothetical protein ABL857_01025 [Rickettsiales bacterium]|jgi:hypothetical protein
MVYIFFGWFIALILWLPVSIGSWLVYFGLISASEMWAMSLATSIVLAIYLSFGDMKKINS